MAIAMAEEDIAVRMAIVAMVVDAVDGATRKSPEVRKLLSFKFELY